MGLARPYVYQGRCSSGAVPVSRRVLRAARTTGQPWLTVFSTNHYLVMGAALSIGIAILVVGAILIVRGRSTRALGATA